MEPLELDNSIKTEVELLKKDVHSIAKLVDKLDVAIDKLTEVTNCLNKMIAVQEQKIEQENQSTKDTIIVIQQQKQLNPKEKEQDVVNPAPPEKKEFDW